MPTEITYKPADILLLGNSCETKMAISQAFKDDFSPGFERPIGVDFVTKKLKVNDNDYQVKIWDKFIGKWPVWKFILRNIHSIALVMDFDKNKTEVADSEEWLRALIKDDAFAASHLKIELVIVATYPESQIAAQNFINSLSAGAASTSSINFLLTNHVSASHILNDLKPSTVQRVIIEMIKNRFPLASADADAGAGAPESATRYTTASAPALPFFLSRFLALSRSPRETTRVLAQPSGAISRPVPIRPEASEIASSQARARTSDDLSSNDSSAVLKVEEETLASRQVAPSAPLLSLHALSATPAAAGTGVTHSSILASSATSREDGSASSVCDEDPASPH